MKTFDEWWAAFGRMFDVLGNARPYYTDTRTDAERIAGDWHTVISCPGCWYCHGRTLIRGGTP